MIPPIPHTTDCKNRYQSELWGSRGIIQKFHFHAHTPNSIHLRLIRLSV